MHWLESIVTRNLPFLTGGIIIGIAASGLLWLNGRRLFRPRLKGPRQ